MISRRNVLSLAGAVAFAIPEIASAQTVGLAERRAIAAYQQDRFPALQKAIQDAAGFAVPIEVAWDQLALPGDAKYYDQDAYFTKTIFEPLAAALKEVGKDQMGRDALKAKLKSIKVRYDEKTSSTNYPNSIKFEGGVLDVNWRPFTNDGDLKPRVAALVDLLEKNL